MSAAKDSFQQALMILTNHQNAKVRLTRAWIERLDKLGSDDVPDCIRDQFSRMRARLTARRPVNNEHPIVATIRKMSPAEASDLNSEIVNMYAHVMSEDGPVQLRIIEAAPEQADDSVAEPGVPDFLSRH